jgi:hypothetical protein
LAASVLLLGCDSERCPEGFVCSREDGGAGGGTATTTTTSSSTSTGGDGGGGSIDPGCIPSMFEDVQSVPAECGIFVEAGSTGTGTKDDPTGDLAAIEVQRPLPEDSGRDGAPLRLHRASPER